MRSESRCASREQDQEAVLSLLRFSDQQHEAAFVARYHSALQRIDVDIMVCGMVFGNLVLLPRLLRNHSWISSSAAMAEASLTVLLRCLARQAPAWYLRHRSCIVGCIFSLHAVCSSLIAPSIFTPGCSNFVAFCLQQFNLSQVPWMSLISLAMPVPFKHAVLAQAAVVGVLLCRASRRHQLSSSLCALTDARYQQVAAAVGAAAACVLPAPLGSVVVQWSSQLRGSVAFYVVDAAMQLAVAYCMVLGVQYRTEWRQRYTFARQRGLAAEMRGLRACRICWHISAATAMLGAALLWLCLCACAAALQAS